jgi:hypothetical protein
MDTVHLMEDYWYKYDNRGFDDSKHEFVRIRRYDPTTKSCKIDVWGCKNITFMNSTCSKYVTYKHTLSVFYITPDFLSRLSTSTKGSVDSFLDKVYGDFSMDKDVARLCLQGWNHPLVHTIELDDFVNE